MIRWDTPWNIKLPRPGIKLPSDSQEEGEGCSEYSVALFRVQGFKPGKTYHVMHLSGGDQKITEKTLNEPLFSLPLQKECEMEVFAVRRDVETGKYTQLKIKLLAISPLLAEGIERNPGYPNPDPPDDW